MPSFSEDHFSLVSCKTTKEAPYDCQIRYSILVASFTIGMFYPFVSAVVFVVLAALRRLNWYEKTCSFFYIFFRERLLKTLLTFCFSLRTVNLLFFHALFIQIAQTIASIFLMNP